MLPEQVIRVVKERVLDTFGTMSAGSLQKKTKAGLEMALPLFFWKYSSYLLSTPNLYPSRLP